MTLSCIHDALQCDFAKKMTAEKKQEKHDAPSEGTSDAIIQNYSAMKISIYDTHPAVGLFEACHDYLS